LEDEIDSAAEGGGHGTLKPVSQRKQRCGFNADQRGGLERVVFVRRVHRIFILSPSGVLGMLRSKLETGVHLLLQWV
jgi:hypothetical protein